MVAQAPGRSSCEQSVFLSQVFSDIRLSEGDNTRRIQFPRLSRRSCTHTKALMLHVSPRFGSSLYSWRPTYQWRIVHTQHNNTLMFRAILTPPSDMRLEHIAAVQEGHLAVLLDPDLVSCVRGDYTQRGDVQAEFARLGEFAQADAEREEVVARDGCGKIGEGLADVVDS